MPFVKRKPVLPLGLPDALVSATEKGQNPNVFYLAATGEVFADYEYVVTLIQKLRSAFELLSPAYFSV